MDEQSASYEQLSEIKAESPTLIEGLPGLGLVASIAVDQITKQLGLDHVGTIKSETFPAVAAFNDGRVRDTFRVYAGDEVITLQSEFAIPPNAFQSLSRCVYGELSDEFEQAIFLAGAPAESNEQVGEIVAVATNDELEAELSGAGITLAKGSGSIGGVTGALASNCYQKGIPATVLIVRSNPSIPDPGAARAVIEDALQPLMGFDIDTIELREQAEDIREKMNQVAQQFKQSQEQQPESSTGPGMYQ